MAIALSRALKLLQSTHHSFLKIPTPPLQPSESTGSDQVEEDVELTRLLAKLNRRMHSQITSITTLDSQSP